MSDLIERVAALRAAHAASTPTAREARTSNGLVASDWLDDAAFYALAHEDALPIIDELVAEAERLRARAEAAEAKVAKLREALEFYAGYAHWDDDGACWSGRINPPEWSEADFPLLSGELDQGKIARAALAETDGGSDG